MSTLTLPNGMYHDAVLKCLYVALEHDCLSEFLASNTIPNVFNDSFEKRTLLGTAHLKGDHASVLPLVTLGANPLKDSEVAIHNGEFGTRRYFDDEYGIRPEEQQIPDLVLIAKRCTFETYVHVCDCTFSRPQDWTYLDLDHVLRMFVTLVDDPGRFHYLLGKLKESNLLKCAINDPSVSRTLNRFHQTLRDKYHNDHNPDLFKALFEHELLLPTTLKQTPISDLIATDLVLKQLSEMVVLTKGVNL